MGNLGEMLKHPDELYLWLKAKMAVKKLHKQIPSESHRKFSSCHSILIKLHRFFILIVNQLSPEFREPISIFYLILRALDTVEDDTSISPEVKVPILLGFHRHIYDPDWHFACGRGTRYEILMDQFHHVSRAFLELGSSYQEVITDITKRMGAGMAKFICKEVETLDDYDEYCHYVSGLVVIGLSKIFHDNGNENLVPDNLSNSLGLFLQKANIIRDYLEDINEKPKSRMFWPREIWSKYAYKLEDFKNEENSTKALQCLNDMVTNALIDVEDTLKYMSELRDPVLMKFLAAPLIMAFGTVALCYNNIQVFRGVVGIRRGLAAKFIYQTKTIADVYGAFYDFASMLKSKVDMSDPNATLTLSRIDAIMKTCQDSGTLNERKSYIIGSKAKYSLTLIIVVFIFLAILCAYLSVHRSESSRFRTSRKSFTWEADKHYYQAM